MSEALARALARMADAGMDQTARDIFADYYRQLADGATGLIDETSIEPLTELPLWTGSPEGFSAAGPDAGTSAAGTSGVGTSAAGCSISAADAIGATAVIKLNGGLATSMGMDLPKSLTPVRGGLSFLDITCLQLRAVREETGASLPLILMDSYHTVEPTARAREAYPDAGTPGIPQSFLQHREPRLWASSLEPVTWPANPELEWCPPGHGDVYPALASTGTLDALISAGYRYVFLSNGDNLGAVPDPLLAQWFANSGAPFAIEVCERTGNDLKGGHVARRRSDGTLLVRDLAQTPPADRPAFMDRHRHRYFNTNNVWVDLRALAALLDERGGVLGLPLIRNEKPIDAHDPSSPAVIQIESAMGAAVSLWPDSRVLAVPRSRFLPVKTTNELALVRSDIFEMTAQWRLVQRTSHIPTIDLDPRYFRQRADFDARFPGGVPSLREVTSLTIRGDVVIEPDVHWRGDVVIQP